MSDDRLSLYSSESRSSILSISGEKPPIQLPRSQNDLHKAHKKKLKQKPSLYTKSKIRRSTTSIVSFKPEPLTLALRKIYQNISKQKLRVKIAESTKTIEEEIELLSLTDSIESIHSVGSYNINLEVENEDQTADTLTQYEKFLRTFENFPDINDISLAELSFGEKKDYGSYVEYVDQTTPNDSKVSLSQLVAPDVESLTNIHDATVSEESFLPLVEENYTSETEFSKQDYTLKSSSSSTNLLDSLSGGSFDRISTIIEISKAKRNEVQQDDFNEIKQFNEIIIKESHIGSKIHKKLKPHETTAELVQHFVSQLINDTVQKCISKGPVLNKSLILRDLMKVIEDYRYEKSLQETLNKRIVAYFYRRRNFEKILPTKSDEIYKIRLQTALNNFDHLVNLHNVTFDLHQSQIEEMKTKVGVMELQTNNQVMKLEDVIRHALNSRPDFQKIKTIINELLKRMSNLRNEISKKRLQLILMQHDVTAIKEKINKFEMIGEGLSVTSYLLIQSEVRNLAKKIRERNAELNRYKTKVISILHMLAHLKTKGLMVKHDLRVARKEFATKFVHKSELRKRVHELTKEHNKLRQDLNEIKTNGTIQQYPLLIDDYDKTVDSNKEKRCIVEDLRIQHEYLAWRVENLENRLTKKQDFKFSTSDILRRSFPKRNSKLMSKDMSIAISRAMSRYGSDNKKFKRFMSSVGIDPVSYEMDDRDSLTTLY